MSVFRYPTYKIRIAPDSQKTQGLQAGDIIRRQYAERERTVYSLMCVTETGTELVGDKDAPYFIGALLDGDEPQGGELLDFVRITNLFDTARSGALYLTASDSDSPYMDVIDPTDEALWNWKDEGIVELCTNNWDYTLFYAYTFYQRAMLNIRYCKEFLDNYPEDCGIPNIKQFRDEVRALRAMNYYYLIDVYRNPGWVWDDSGLSRPRRI